MVPEQKPGFKSQDLYSAFSLVAGFLGAQSDSIPFILGWSAAAMVLFILGIGAHDELPLKSRIIATVFIAVVLIVFDASKAHSLREADLKINTGLLKPKGDPQPLSKCPVPVGALAIYAGQSAVWGLQFPVVVFEMSGYHLLTIDKDKSGGLLIDALIFDDRDNLIAKINKNKYLVLSCTSTLLY